MKIGILTYPLNNNYGCYLQSYALLHFLKNKGYDVEYINRRHNKPSWAFYLKYAVKTLLKNLLTFKWESPIFHYEWHYMMKKGVQLYPFFEQNIVPHTKAIYTTEKLKSVCQRYNVVIVGSDQVWRAELLESIEDYFFAFIEDERVKKIAYAASFGKITPGYTDTQKIICGNALSSFKAVSVREDIGVKLIDKYNWKCPKCEVVIDPTMLLKKSDYKVFFDNPAIESKILVYLLDETNEKRNIANQVSNLLNAGCNFILEGHNVKDFVYPSINYWLSCYSMSSFIVTDSYHGVVFSIIFNIPFAVIINDKRGADRFVSLLNTFNLETRVVHGINDVDRIVFEKIDWCDVNKILNREQKRAESFLLNNLGNP